MFIKNEHYETMLAIRKFLPEEEAFNALSEEDQTAIVKFDCMLLDYLKEQKARNKKVAATVAEKRKENKNYGRTPYIKKSTDMYVFVGKQNGYDVYRKVFFDGIHYYVKWNKQQIIVDDDIENRNYTYS